MKQPAFENAVILVTGAAGFIGFHLARTLLREHPGARVVGLDNMNDYYDLRLKEARLKELRRCGRFAFVRGDIADKGTVAETFRAHRPRFVVHLAAQAGVRHSLTHPDAYVKSNLVGFFNILEAVRHACEEADGGVRHLLFASSSSVYGCRSEKPCAPDDNTDRPASLYAATKKADELLAYAYSALYRIPTTALRFFTVYGPQGRPDMAYFSFTEKLLKGGTIRLFNEGNCKRDFTYIDDVVEAVCRIMDKTPRGSCETGGRPAPPYAVYNIGHGHPESLRRFVGILRQELERAGLLPAGFRLADHTEQVAMQPGDVPVTHADVSALERDFGFRPSTSLQTGLRKFVEWYGDFYAPHKELAEGRAALSADAAKQVRARREVRVPSGGNNRPVGMEQSSPPGGTIVPPGGDTDRTAGAHKPKGRQA